MNADEVKIFIADDHPIFRNGLRQLIETAPNFVVIGEAKDGKEAIDHLTRLPADIALLDIDMPHADGFEVLAALREKGLTLQFVFLTMHKDEEFLNTALDLGVKGFLVKDSAAEEVIDCLNLVAHGQEFISPQLTGFLLERLRQAKARPPREKLLAQLTLAECNVLRLIAEYKTNKEIAAVLNIGIRTVERHRLNITDKLNLDGRHALMRFAIENKERLGERGEG